MTLSPAQARATWQIAAGDLSGIRPATYGVLVGAGLVEVSHRTISERFRPAAHGFTRERWSRSRTILGSAKLTPAGIAWIAAQAGPAAPTAG